MIVDDNIAPDAILAETDVVAPILRKGLVFEESLYASRGFCKRAEDGEDRGGEERALLEVVWVDIFSQEDILARINSFDSLPSVELFVSRKSLLGFSLWTRGQ
jgi:hypothetical protein